MNTGKIQNVRAFTVQVRGPKEDSIAGTAFVVDREQGLLVTCLHVVEAAIAMRVEKEMTVWIYFPQLHKDDRRLRRARVARMLDGYSDDVVVLQIVGEDIPNTVGVAVLGDAKNSSEHNFRSFGYRRLQLYQGLPARGLIVGLGDPPLQESVFGAPLMLMSQHIDSGMSGAAVLDVERNLVVGVISATWDTKGFHDRDTSFAVEGIVLSLGPLNLKLHEEFPLESSARPLIEAQAVQPDASTPDFPLLPLLVHAPDLLNEKWVPRKMLSGALRDAWRNPQMRVVGLVGFGGEGKSSLARQFVEELSVHDIKHGPDAVIWWDFHSNSSVDSFLQATVSYLGGVELSQRYQSSFARVELIGAMLQERSLLCVLDGLEVLQTSDSTHYGTLTSKLLTRFFELMAGFAAHSLCIVTSRLPLIDLHVYPTYWEYEVGRLNVEEGERLLRTLGVVGSTQELFDLVTRCGGHALTLTLAANELKAKHGGEIGAGGPSIPYTSSSEYEPLWQILQRYNDLLTTEELKLLGAMSVYRAPVKREGIVDPELVENTSNSPESMVVRLSTLGVIQTEELHPEPLLSRSDYHTGQLAGTDSSTGRRLSREGPVVALRAHPLIKEYYYASLTPTFRKYAHLRAFNYYMREVERLQSPVANPEIVSGSGVSTALNALTEEIYHLSQAGLYDEAFSIYNGSKASGLHVADRFQAFETCLAILSNFFPSGNFSLHPLTIDEGITGRLYNDVGLLMRYVGRLRDAIFHTRKSIELSRRNGVKHVRTLVNLTDILVLRGELRDAYAAALNALESAEDLRERLVAYSAMAWASFSLGLTDEADRHYNTLQNLELELQANNTFLFSQRGVKYAKYLIRTGRFREARTQVEKNLRACQQHALWDDVSQCFLILGRLAREEGDYDRARQYFTNSRTLANKLGLILYSLEAQLGQAMLDCALERWHLAESNSRAALQLATDGGLVIHEIDVRIALAHSLLGNNSLQEAFELGQTALALAKKVGYVWGEGDALHLLGVTSRAQAADTEARRYFSDAKNLREQHRDPEATVSGAALATLTADFSELLAMLQGGDRATTAEAATLLRNTPSEQVILALYSLLKDEDPRVHLAARNSLLFLRAIALPILKRLLQTENNEKSLIGLLNILAEIEDPEIGHVVTPFLQHPASNVKLAALKSIGQTVSLDMIESIIRLLFCKVAPVREEAIKVLSSNGASSIPYLGDLLTTQDHEVQKAAAKTLARIGTTDAILMLIPLLADAKSDIRNLVATTIIHHNHSAVVDAVVRLLNSQNPLLRSVSAEMLGHMKATSALQVLIPLLADPDRQARSSAARGLAMFGDGAISELILALKHDEMLIRAGAVEALGQIGGERVIVPLLNALQDHEDKVGMVAAAKLGEIAHPRTVEPLIRALNNGGWQVRTNSAASLSAFNDDRVVTALTAALRNARPEVIINALSSLGKLKAAHIGPELVELINHENNQVKQNAIKLLGQFKTASAVEPLLERFATRSEMDLEVRAIIAIALGDLADLRAIKPLIEALSDLDWHDEAVQRFAASVLKGLSRFGEPVLGDLTDLLLTENPILELLIPEVYKAIGSASSRYLIARVDDANDVERRVLYKALGKIGGTSVLSQMVSGLKDRDEVVRGLAAAFIFDLAKGTDQHVIEHLIESLRDSAELVRRNAAGTLGRFRDIRAVNPLIVALEDTEPLVRLNATVSLAEIGETACVPFLLKMLSDSDERVRKKVVWALQKLGHSSHVANVD